MNFNRLTRFGIAGALTLAQWALCFTLLGYSQPLMVSGQVAKGATPAAVTASRIAPTTSQVFEG
jgi:hypothetical protein